MITVKVIGNSSGHVIFKKPSLKKPGSRDFNISSIPVQYSTPKTQITSDTVNIIAFSVLNGLHILYNTLKQIAIVITSDTVTNILLNEPSAATIDKPGIQDVFSATIQSPTWLNNTQSAPGIDDFKIFKMNLPDTISLFF